ncbi:MAG: relaxase/mobilization nuclease domain-containing protein [Phormidesmis sp. RL_2_1]|nr:relaxase/mobilization nuclease domain-containing protein [Phormidesmis sp. RL_2_1]
MIGKSTTGNDFYGCVRYALDEKSGLKQAHIIGGNTIGCCAAELSAEFSQNQQAKPYIKNPVWHVALSSPIHEQLSDAQWQQVAIAYLDFMGLARNNHQYVVIRHHDEPQGHVHIVANRIGEDGSVHHLRWDRLRTIQTTRMLEEKFSFLSAKPGEGLRQRVRSLINEATLDQPSLLTFCQRLEKQGLMPELYQREGKITGIAYLYRSQRMAGSVLGKSYSLPGLQKIQQVSYQPKKDFASLVQMGYTRLYGAKAPWPSRAQIAWMLRTGQLTPRIQQWMREKGTDPEQLRAAGFTYEQMRDGLQQLSQGAISQHSSSHSTSLKQHKSGLEL